MEDNEGKTSRRAFPKSEAAAVGALALGSPLRHRGTED
jgi:hypothetical protein